MALFLLHEEFHGDLPDYEAQKWFDKIRGNADENKVKLRRQIIVNPRSIVDYAEDQGDLMICIC